MLSGQLIRSGDLRDYTALGGVGYPVYAAAAQIRAAVAKQLGKEYADFLANPQFDSKGETIDWYAEAEGDIVPWQAASESERAFLRGRVAEICARIEEKARQIQAAPSGNDQLVFGRLLALCTRIPDDSHLYLIDGKPLVTFWGFVKAGSDSSQHVLANLPSTPAASIRAAPLGEVSESVRRAWWWQWLLWPLLLLLLLALMLFGLRSCEIAQPYISLLPDFIQGVVNQPEPETIGPDGQIVVPGQGIVIGPDGSVVPGTGVDAVPGEETLPVDTMPEAETTLPSPDRPADQPEDQAGAENGEQPNDEQQSDDKQTPPQPDQMADQPENQSENQPESQPGADMAPPIKPIEIPDQASANADPSFMEGDWRSKTGLVAKNSKGPVSIDYKFDKSGKGTTTLRMQNGVSCSGPSSVNMANGGMTVQDQGNLTCTNGQTFAGSTVECVKDSAGQTKCTGKYPNGQTYDIVLGR